MVTPADLVWCTGAVYTDIYCSMHLKGLSHEMDLAFDDMYG